MPEKSFILPEVDDERVFLSTFLASSDFEDRTILSGICKALGLNKAGKRTERIERIMLAALESSDVLRARQCIVDHLLIRNKAFIAPKRIFSRNGSFVGRDAHELLVSPGGMCQALWTTRHEKLLSIVCG